jgi:hypothetical protein
MTTKDKLRLSIAKRVFAKDALPGTTGNVGEIGTRIRIEAYTDGLVEYYKIKAEHALPPRQLDEEQAADEALSEIRKTKDNLRSVDGEIPTFFKNLGVWFKVPMEAAMPPDVDNK